MRGGARLIPKGSCDNCVFLLSCPWSVCDTSITSVTNRCGSLLIVPSQHPAVIVADAVLTMEFRACQGNIISTYMYAVHVYKCVAHAHTREMLVMSQFYWSFTSNPESPL
jgi:hypothetical protein